MSKFTSKFIQNDGIDIGVPIPLLRKWERVMNIIWSFLKGYEKVADGVIVYANENTIHYRKGFTNKIIITVFFVNKKYLELSIKIEGNNEFEAKVSHIDTFEKKLMITTLASIIDAAEKIKTP